MSLVFHKSGTKLGSIGAIQRARQERDAVKAELKKAKAEIKRLKKQIEKLESKIAWRQLVAECKINRVA